jgi:hypothetical protein
MNRKILLAFFVAIALVANSFSLSMSTAKAVALTTVGQWDFCTPTQSTSCIKNIVVTSTEGVETTYSTREAATAATVEYSVYCGPVECSGSPTMKQVQSFVNGGCKTDLGLGLNRPWLNISAGVRDHPTWTISIEINTGTHDPVFTLGKGTVKTQRTENADGTFSFVWVAKPVIIARVGLSKSFGDPSTNSRYTQDLKDFYSTAVATTVEYSASVNVLPATHFLIGNCAFFPLAGGWAEANAQGFLFGADFSKLGSDPTKQIFPFSAYAPHFIPGEWMTNIPLGPVRPSPVPIAPLPEANRIINPARVQMFLPPDYLKMLGYDDLSTFTISSFSVVVEDGQNLNPSFAVQNGGVLLDFGISHYSVPNPTLTVLVRQKAAASTNPTSQVFTLVLTRQKSAKSIASFAKLKVLSTSKVSLKVVTSSAKFCKVFGTNLKGLKTGSCKVTVTVTPKKGKASSKTVTLKVTK